MTQHNSRNSGGEEGEPTPLECGPFHDLTTFSSWDAVRVWSTGSNGANFSWFAQWSRAEEQMQEAIESMNIMIKTDQTRLTTWQQHINRVCIPRLTSPHLTPPLTDQRDRRTQEAQPCARHGSKHQQGTVVHLHAQVGVVAEEDAGDQAPYVCRAVP